ncbi:MAG: TrkA family potassium uptake protein [Chloroflexi bacterium]|nr:TrkA family potassium uptake protein [Chloroflexota bacterium]
MYIIVVGAGKMGYHLAKALLKSEHEVFIIERSSLKSETIREELGSLVIVGDGCEEAVLKEAGTSRADVFIAATGADEDNLVACQIAKHRFQVPRTISIINNPNNEKLFVELGIDVCVSSTDIILSHIEEELPAHSLIHFMAIRGSNREVVGIRIPPDAAVVGRVLGDVPIPEDSLISFILKKDGTLMVPDSEAVLGSGDEVVAITTADGEEALREALTGAA